VFFDEFGEDTPKLTTSLERRQLLGLVYTVLQLLLTSARVPTYAHRGFVLIDLSELMLLLSPHGYRFFWLYCDLVSHHGSQLVLGQIVLKCT